MNDLTHLLSFVSQAERGYTKRLNRCFQQAGYDLRREQYELLRLLWEKDNVNQQTIARGLQKDKYNVTKLLNALQKRGYVRREMGEDKRNNLVKLSGKGLASREALQAIEEQLHADLAITLSPADVKSGTWVLTKLAIALDV
ncbi:MAG: MarR family transcriptional regulator [Odoribacteraceae bacterium]|jgi:DNA-binding MarR family transcriptional regulator|nr:MarR family transcriptional regulator [Odoribacteraceae bacterium]